MKNNLNKIIILISSILLSLLLIFYLYKNITFNNSKITNNETQSITSTSENNELKIKSLNLKTSENINLKPNTETNIENDKTKAVELTTKTLPIQKSNQQHLVKNVQFPKPVNGTITGNAVNIRSESRITTTNVITKVNKGEVVKVLGYEKPENDNKIWYKVMLKNNKIGYVREDLIKIDQ